MSTHWLLPSKPYLLEHPSQICHMGSLWDLNRGCVASNSNWFGFHSLYRASNTGKFPGEHSGHGSRYKGGPGAPLVVTSSKNPNLQKFVESNGPVPAQGRIYVYDHGPMLTSPGIIRNYLVLGLRFHRFWPNVCSNEHTSKGETNSRFTIKLVRGSKLLPRFGLVCFRRTNHSVSYAS